MLTAPILLNKYCTEPSVFTPENLLREARQQKSLPSARVPRICVLDPDGDIVRWLVGAQRAERDARWACYQAGGFKGAGRVFTDSSEGVGVFGGGGSTVPRG